MSQCLRMAEMMFNAPMPPPVISPLKRKSVGELPDQVLKRQAVVSPGETSPRGLPLSASVMPCAGTQPVNIQPRPNGYCPAPSAPTPPVSAAAYTPAPTGRKRGRPPKTGQNTWLVSTYPPITPAPIAPSPASTAASQPHSPGLRGHPAYHTTHQVPSGPKLKKKVLPEIAPRPAQGVLNLEPPVRSPALPGAEYQSWREETTRREYDQLQGSETAAREPALLGHTPTVPHPRTPHPHPSPREIRPTLPEPAQPRETPPATSPGTVKTESHTTAAAVN